MEDCTILELYHARSEEAITKSAEKYGRYCYSIAYNILYNAEDSEECVNDTWLRAWNVIPPQKPNVLSAFFGKITRNLSLDRWRRKRADKRGHGEVSLAIEELGECVPSSESVERAVEDHELTEVLNRFLASLPAEKRKIFLRRYWYLSPVREIAQSCGFTESKVKMVLMRTREELRKFLEKEGIVL